jgi:hypothetical protein
VENQHRKITGYRELNAFEISLMNSIKAKEAEVAELVQLVRNTVEPGEPQRQAAIAVTVFEEAFMRLVRAVARPASPWERRP